MINKITIARPYARAALLIAQKDNSYHDWLEFFSTLSISVSEKKIILFLKDPMIDKDRKIFLLFECYLKSKNVFFVTFLKLLSLKNRLLFLPAIFVLFKSYVYEKDCMLEVTVVTAFLLRENEQRELLMLLTKKFNKKIFVNFFVNSFIIGGVLIRMGNMIFDNTIKENLISLRNYLVSS